MGTTHDLPEGFLHRHASTMLTIWISDLLLQLGKSHSPWEINILLVVFPCRFDIKQYPLMQSCLFISCFERQAEPCLASSKQRECLLMLGVDFTEPNMINWDTQPRWPLSDLTVGSSSLHPFFPIASARHVVVNNQPWSGSLAILSIPSVSLVSPLRSGKGNTGVSWVIKKRKKRKKDYTTYIESGPFFFFYFPSHSRKPADWQQVQQSDENKISREEF